jgi:amino acid adenylation domain-containing protein
MPTEKSSSHGSDLSEAKRRLIAHRLKGVSTGHQKLQHIQPRAAGAKTPMSPDQYRMWLHASVQPHLPTYNEPITLRYRGRLDVAFLEAALNRIVQRHEIWRTSFSVEPEEVLQVVHPELRIQLNLVDLSDLPEAERESEANRLATEQALLPIDTTKLPLFRTLVVRLAPEEYRLYLVLHHILFDGMSIQRILVPELAAIYAALEAGVEPALPNLPLQYSDYALWRHQQVDSPVMEHPLEYWRAKLSGELPILRLPSDRPRPPALSHRGGTERFIVPRELNDSLRELGRAHGVTLHMTLLAVFKVLLFRYSGQEDVIVGGVADGRRRSELQGMMGYILDTFAVRTHPSSQLTFSAFLAEVKITVLEALDAAEVPFDRVLQAIHCKRDLSHHPIFQTFFSFQPAALDEASIGWEATPTDVTVGAAKFDLSLEVEERSGYAAARIVYSADLFDADTIRRLSGHWLTLLEAVCKTPESKLGDLPLLTAQESELMLVRWNDQGLPVPATTIHRMIEEQTRRTPDRPAVEFENTSWTYKQLDQQAEIFASCLRDAGAAPDRLVALCIDRSSYLLAGLLGILKTGAAYLPLDPGTPLARIQMCLEDATPVIVLTQRSLASHLSTGGATLLVLEDIMESGAHGLKPPSRVAAPARVAEADDTAYVIYTSGSTGRPKAVEIRHGSVVNLLVSMQREPGFIASDTLLAVTTVSFDIAALEFFLPLVTGGEVVIASRRVAVDPNQLQDMIRSTGCTVLQATPATWRALLAADWRGHPGLRCLCGGEALTRDLAEALLALDLELWNVYGPTETTIWSTVRRVRSGTGPVSIGRPIANTTTFILDANQQPTPIGVAGELYIGGLGMAKGYRGQPSLTAQKFCTLAIAGDERLYRTGDYAVYRADGTIECQGRADNQVKVRGYRIELEDVEANVNAHPRVASAAAKVWPDATGGNRLSVYLVGKNGPPPNSAEMREFLQSRLPEYMIPSDILALDAMPLTPNGKMDRQALQKPELGLARAVSPPLSMEEEEGRLARIWSEILGVDSVGPGDNFFALGGHSLLLVRLFARINKEFDSDLPITTIFDTQTLSELARVLKDKVRVSSLVPVRTSGSMPPVFMAHSYLLYHALSSTLGEDQPFYGLRELAEDANESIEERAFRYVADMRRVQPYGPYQIAGWCAAGPLAVEIARQLIFAGEEVALLALFDSWLPGYAESLKSVEGNKSYAKAFAGRLSGHKTKLLGLSMANRMRYLWRLFLRISKEARDEFYIKHWSRMNALSKRFDIPLPQFMHNTTLQTFAAMRQFRTEAIPVKITLIRATESLRTPGASDSCGWEQIAELGVDVLWAPGDHETMFRDSNLQITAQLVRESIANALSVDFTEPFEYSAV